MFVHAAGQRRAEELEYLHFTCNYEAVLSIHLKISERLKL